MSQARLGSVWFVPLFAARRTEGAHPRAADVAALAADRAYVATLRSAAAAPAPVAAPKAPFAPSIVAAAEIVRGAIRASCEAFAVHAAQCAAEPAPAPVAPVVAPVAAPKAPKAPRPKAPKAPKAPPVAAEPPAVAAKIEAIRAACDAARAVAPVEPVAVPFVAVPVAWAIAQVAASVPVAPKVTFAAEPAPALEPAPVVAASPLERCAAPLSSPRRSSRAPRFGLCSSVDATPRRSRPTAGGRCDVAPGAPCTRPSSAPRAAEPAPRAPKAPKGARRAKMDPGAVHPAIARWHAIQGALESIAQAVKAPGLTFARAKRADEKAAEGATYDAPEGLDRLCDVLAAAAPVLEPIVRDFTANAASIRSDWRTDPKAPAFAGPRHTADGLLGPALMGAIDRLHLAADQALAETAAIRADTLPGGAILVDVGDLRAWARTLPRNVRSVAFDAGDQRVAMRVGDLRAACDASIRRGCTSVTFGPGDGARSSWCATFAWANVPPGGGAPLRGRLRFRTHAELVGCTGRRSRDGVAGDVAIDLRALASARRAAA